MIEALKGVSHSLSLALMLLCFSKLRLSLSEQLEIKLQPKERVYQEDGLNKNAISIAKTEGHEDSRKINVFSETESTKRCLKNNVHSLASLRFP